MGQGFSVSSFVWYMGGLGNLPLHATRIYGWKDGFPAFMLLAFYGSYSFLLRWVGVLAVLPALTCYLLRTAFLLVFLVNGIHVQVTVSVNPVICHDFIRDLKGFICPPLSSG
jgi:Na+/H+ antiporter NhaC